MTHLLRYQEFSAWMTDSMHDAGGLALTGPFRQMTALARLYQPALPSTR
jgi:p-hydroxybenzoate 3-monooxygenase